VQAFFLNPKINRCFSWVQKGGFAVLDQTLFAGTNFLVGVLLARWLEPNAYGAFSTAYAVFLFVGTLHAALWTEPMLVYGSGKFREQYQQYQKILLAYHWRFGLTSSAVFILLGIFFFYAGQAELGRSFVGLAIASPLILYLWLIRRSAYVLLTPQHAAFGGLLYMLLYIGISFILLQFNILDETSALSAMGIAGLLSGKLVERNIHKQKKYHTEPETVETNTIYHLHWQYGRWAILAGGLSWVPGNIYFLVLPAIKSLDASAALKALMNLAMPILHFNSALAGLFVPIFVRAIQNNGLKQKLQIGSSLVFWVILIVWGEWLTIFVYNERYIFNLNYFVLLGIFPLLSSIANTISAVLRAENRPEEVARAYTYAVAGTVLIGLPLAYWQGIIGALSGIVIANGLLVFGLLIKFKDSKIKA
jgi:O-antigen/teichoic acid export membrane protein